MVVGDKFVQYIESLSIQTKIIFLLNPFYQMTSYLCMIYSGGKQHLQQWKTVISPSNVAQNTNPGTVLTSACPEDSKTPPTC